MGAATGGDRYFIPEMVGAVTGGTLYTGNHGSSDSREYFIPEMVGAVTGGTLYTGNRGSSFIPEMVGVVTGHLVP